MAKVCHITSVHSSYDGRIFRKECSSLSNYGHEVVLIVNELLDDEIKNNVLIKSTNYKPKNRLARIIISQYKIYKKAIEEDADIYHFHDPELLQVGLKLKRNNKKVIFDSHENYTMLINQKYYIPKTIRSFISKLYNKYETYVCKKIDAVIIPCTFNKKNIFEGRSKKSILLNNVPKLDEYYDKYEDIVKDKNSVCYVGSISEERGISVIIKACHRANVKLILAGTFTPLSYENQLKCMPEYSCVNYRGFANVKEIHDIYNESFAGLCTLLDIGQYNISDNLPTKVYEYMSMGLPVIMSKQRYAMEDLGRHEFAIEVDPSNICEIQKAIELLKGNRKLAQRMGSNGRKLVGDFLNWGVEQSNLIELYDEICKELI